MKILFGIVGLLLSVQVLAEDNPHYNMHRSESECSALAMIGKDTVINTRLNPPSDNPEFPHVAIYSLIDVLTPPQSIFDHRMLMVVVTAFAYADLVTPEEFSERMLEMCLLDIQPTTIL